MQWAMCASLIPSLPIIHVHTYHHAKALAHHPTREVPIVTPTGSKFEALKLMAEDRVSKLVSRLQLYCVVRPIAIQLLTLRTQSTNQVCLVSIMRAGDSLMEAARRLVPKAVVGASS